MEEASESKLTGYCPHGNVPDECPICLEAEDIREEQNSKKKPERVKRVFESGALDDQRFLLPRNPEARRNLRNFQAMYRTMKRSYPKEIVSMILGGSQIKGYADGESDFDSVLYIDEQEAVAVLDVDNLKPEDIITAQDLQNLKDNPRGWYTTIDEPDPVAASQDKANLTREAVLLKYTKLVQAGLKDRQLDGNDRYVSVAVH